MKKITCSSNNNPNLNKSHHVQEAWYSVCVVSCSGFSSMLGSLVQRWGELLSKGLEFGTIELTNLAAQCLQTYPYKTTCPYNMLPQPAPTLRSLSVLVVHPCVHNTWGHEGFQGLGNVREVPCVSHLEHRNWHGHEERVIILQTYCTASKALESKGN